MIRWAVRLLAQRGLQATSFSEILELTGAPRGSVYHHFPKGKDELIMAALDAAGAHALTLLDSAVDFSAEETTLYFVQVWRDLLIQLNFSAGCAVVAVTVATDLEALMAHAANVFRSWRSRLTQLLHKGGLTDSRATGFAAILIASCEGAVVLARAERSLEPFDLVAENLLDQVRRLAENP